MKFKDLFIAFNEWSPATIIEIHINHEIVLMQAGEVVYEYGNLPVVSFYSRTVYLKRRIFKMMKAQIVYYKEEDNKFYGFYFNRHFTACSFRFEEDIREFLLTSGYELSPEIREVDFDTHMEASREWNKLASEHLSYDDWLNMVEIMIRKLMILKELTYGIPKKDTYKSAIFMSIDELEEELNYWKMLYKLTKVGGI